MKQPLLALAALAILGVIMPASPARAQGRSAYGFTSASRAGAGFSRHGAASRRLVLVRHGRRFYSDSALVPNYYPYYDSDYDSEDRAVDAPPAPVWQPAPAPLPTSPSKPVESLVMELRGDHWVRLTNYGATNVGEQPGELPSSETNTPALSKTSAAPVRTSAPPSELPSVVLVFRDGHQEQAAKYTIVDATIYIKGDYWTTGSWTRSIPIVDLNLAVTLQLNQQRGAKFTLPSRPSEIIVR